MMRAYRFYFFSSVLIIFSFMAMTMAVNATGEKRLQHKNAYYEEIEDQYIRTLRQTLSDSGYRNAGITMTKVFETDGTRDYTVKLHHKRMERLSEEEREELLGDLAHISFPDASCSVYLKFL